MLRIHFTAEDLTRVRFAPRPSPLPELHAALMMLGAPHEGLLFGSWRGRVLRALPGAAEPLAELVPGGAAPYFLDVLGETREEGFALIREARPDFVRSELARVYAGGGRVPPWIRALHDGEAGAWRTFDRAQRAAYEAVLAPVWPLVQDLHRAEFTRHALTAAERGLEAALTAVVPGSRLRDGVWECPGAPREVRLDGRGLVLLPTFHWRGGPLVQDLPDRPVVLTYPAGGGLPPVPGTAAPAEALAAVLGRTRTELLYALEEGRTTTALARRLGVSNATASAHAAALRAAGLITTTRTGRSVQHERTALGGLLAAPAP
ncbi:MULTISPECIES: helix-turn-helix domain-containing protein [unclassified Streptomyces]|uniref:helix-turn-helix domain-containing protein n=1 Tax=unclassified Streptomyces TaxID=2593676 RepID=UPI0007001AE9|nr:MULTISPECIES: helix-turn-helix domain-containing protein [unclassified Streptomyces]KQX52711.1 regulator [Streptomyces sp. Root1304]KRA89626.1 regulator [Streptomyces sp. Root66D1]